MKTVFNSAMVAHVWAQQRQSSGRNTSGSLYFNDSTIYSYGSHFPIARFVRNGEARQAVLYTSRDYSVSTSCHKSYVWGAIPSEIPRFIVVDPLAMNHYENMERFQACADEALQKATRARRWADMHLQEAIGHWTQANDYADFFSVPGLRFAKPCVTDELRERIKNAAAIAKAARKKQDEERAKLVANVVAEFRAGRVNMDAILREIPPLLRVMPGRDKWVQTSYGAVVPLAAGKVMLARILAHWRNGSEYLQVDWSIGDFRIDTITPTHVYAGCHQFERTEIERFAAELGVTCKRS